MRKHSVGEDWAQRDSVPAIEPMLDERAAWDRRYREGSHSSLSPDPLLVSAYEDFLQPLFPNGGTALDLAGGVGRHAVWLAERGWQVTLIDISPIAIAKAQQNSERWADRIACKPGDLSRFKAGRTKYDLVLVFFYLERRILLELVRALRPGGLLIYKTYTRLQRKFGGGPTHPMHLLKENELLRAFPKLAVLYYRETICDRGVAEFVGRKPT